MSFSEIILQPRKKAPQQPVPRVSTCHQKDTIGGNPSGRRFTLALRLQW
jgi:hypothetical protein